jgi:hypothetical protein
MTNSIFNFNDTMTDIALNFADAAMPQLEDATDELIADFDKNIAALQGHCDDTLITALQTAMNRILPDYDNFNE